MSLVAQNSANVASDIVVPLVPGHLHQFFKFQVGKLSYEHVTYTRDHKSGVPWRYAAVGPSFDQRQKLVLHRVYSFLCVLHYQCK